MELNTARNLAQMILSPRVLRALGWTYGIACAALWISLFVAFFAGSDAKPARSIGPDFSAFYSAGWMVRNGQSASLYDFDAQQKIQQQLVLNAGANDLSAWVHPPHGAWLLAPLTRFSPRAAYAIYCAFLLACFGAGLWVLRQNCARLKQKPCAGIWVLALLSAPVYFSFSAGQNTGAMFLLQVVAITSLARNREFASGFSVAIGLLKPHLFLAWLPFWIANKKWRALATFAIGAILVVVSSMWFFGADVFAREWQTLGSQTYQKYETLHAFKMFSWLSFWRLSLGHSFVATALGALCSLAVLARTIWLWTKSDDTILLGALSVASIVLMVPHLPVYDLALLLIPVLIFTDRVLELPLERLLDLRLCLLALIVFVTLGEEWARATQFQIVVPLLTFVWWRAQSLLQSEPYEKMVA